MAADKYRFISPGVFITEVDQSQIPSLDNGERGPVVIGRARRGPSFRPSRVISLDQYVQLFGEPVAGGGAPPDGWRTPGLGSPMYGTYAAEAYLSNNQPVTYLRLLGAQHPTVTGTGAGTNGWNVPTAASNRDATGGAGAMGLFIWPSSSAGTATNATGTLAAVWYCNTGIQVLLSGNIAQGADDPPAAAVTASQATLIQSQGASTSFLAAISSSASGLTGGGVKAFNFSRNDVNYIRNVFNTDATKLNTNLYSGAPSLVNYVLGPTFERAVADLAAPADGKGYLGCILELADATTHGGQFSGIADTDGGPPTGQTGWFFSQDTGQSGSFNPLTSTTNLFKLHALYGAGEQTQNEIKISIRDIKFPSAVEQAKNPYPTFTVEVRRINDTDRAKVVLETFSGMDLNPASPNYIASVIGDRYLVYNSTTLRTEERGDHPNKSKFIRVEVSEEVADGSAMPSLMPFGVVGPPKFNNFTITRQDVGAEDKGWITGSISGANRFVLADDLSTVPLVDPIVDANTVVMNFGSGITGSMASLLVEFPSIPLVANASQSTTANSQTNAYFGVDLQTSAGSKIMSPDIPDLIKTLPGGLTGASAATTNQYVFTLDYVRNSVWNGTGDWTYASGSRNLAPAAGASSWTAMSGAANLVNNQKINKFTTVLHGGFDGLDIRELDPFRNTLLAGTNVDSGKYSGVGETQNYAVHSIQRALNTIKDPEFLDFNLAAMPGITNVALTDELVDLCEERGDSLAVIDIENDYRPRAEGAPPTYPIMPDLSAAATGFRQRSTDSSYGCAFFPWVQTRDRRSGQLIWIPPSVAALGTIGSSAARSELWFAPAGFNRGGLTNGSAGIPVINVRKKLTSDERDILYENRINPIAAFPSEGIVVFGQKTLQVEASALDRINVRRLLIHLKKKISNIANQILFDQNVPATWARFKGQVDPFLNDVKTRFGLTDYKVVLDEKTTTPDLIDRNILYAKIYLKPARAIEYIALDFFITSSGASFED